MGAASDRADTSLSGAGGAASRHAAGRDGEAVEFATGALFYGHVAGWDEVRLLELSYGGYETSRISEHDTSRTSGRLGAARRAADEPALVRLVLVVLRLQRRRLLGYDAGVVELDVAVGLRVLGR
jgi:hypothetical protein